MHTSHPRAPHTTTAALQFALGRLRARERLDARATLHPRATLRSRARLRLRASLRALASCAAMLCAAAGAQSTATTHDAPVVGIHYQDLLPSDGDTIQVFLPRPQIAAWEGVMLSSSDECLELGALGDHGPDHVLVLDVRLTGSGTEGEHGNACSATIVASYRGASTTWDGANQVFVNRLVHPPVPDGVIEATLTIDRISVPVEPGARSLATLVDLTLTNRGTEPVDVLGLADEAQFTALVGSVYQYDQPLDGTLAGLEAVGRPLAETTLAPGGSARIALVLDPASRLPDGSAVLTVQPAIVVRIGKDRYSLRFERMSTTWGNELP